MTLSPPGLAPSFLTPSQKEGRFDEEPSDPGVGQGVLFYFFPAFYLLTEPEYDADSRRLLQVVLPL